MTEYRPPREWRGRRTVLQLAWRELPVLEFTCEGDGPDNVWMALTFGHRGSDPVLLIEAHFDRGQCGYRLAEWLWNRLHREAEA